MTRTRRIYNNPRLKKTPRVNIDDGDDTNWYAGIPLTYQSWICMGHCPICRNPEKEPKLLRRKNKDLLRLLIRLESE